jgi:hypothetical protein
MQKHIGIPNYFGYGCHLISVMGKSVDMFLKKQAVFIRNITHSTW